VPNSAGNRGKPWTQSDLSALERYAAASMSTRVVALKLGRTEGAVKSKADELKIPLKAPKGRSFRKTG
jgi:hypothetical protein